MRAKESICIFVKNKNAHINRLTNIWFCLAYLLYHFYFIFAIDFVKKYGLSKNIHGANLSVSGGERQRISIARNLLKKAAIYIFDDSFANLDFKTDLSLRKSILSRLKNNTVILISQRISTIKNLDKIIVLESGNLIGFDSHKNLMENCPTYKKMVNLQLGEEA